MNEILAIFIAAALPLFIILLFVHLVRERNERIQVEQEVEPIGIFTGGGRFQYGALTTKFTYPFVQVRAYPEFVVISYSSKWMFRYSEILSVKESFGGLVIRHRKPDYPDKIVVAVGTEELITLFREKGVEVLN
ncbi:MULTISPECIES: hypothetical protein [Paenibacillus]|uniref:hypothetical protein n=1 Tax=Paenibacillus TaxID=44249 RepID=UPI0022B9032C|nr:hypothetical protein [Paenibacillus caseinilyticus]MCZ8521061.1 hypothetical protein [Paenibacillus caseinilyticus]